MITNTEEAVITYKARTKVRSTSLCKEKEKKAH